MYKTQYKPKSSQDDPVEHPAAPTERKSQYFENLFSQQMKKYQKTSSDDELKSYLTDHVVDPDLLVKEKSGIDGVLGWWKV